MRAAIWPVLVATLAFSLAAPAHSPVSARRSVGGGFIKAAHYFGLSRYAWPINYLNTVELARVDTDLAQIAADGFNAIVLLVSWGEVEPSLVPQALYSEAALGRLDAIIKSAKVQGLQVIFRLPYLWAINPDQQLPNTQRMNALFYDDHVRDSFIEAVRMLDRRLVRPNPNVRFAFATWEDFWGITQVPEEALPPAFKEGFSEFARGRHDDARLASMLDTNVDRTGLVPVPKQNAPGWQLFLEFVDDRIEAITAEMGRALSVPLSYEVRVDGDPIVVGGRVTEWFKHNKTYDVRTSDITTVYYAPYISQRNEGERLTAEQAMEGFRRMYDQGVRRFTKNRLFIDQFNVVYNTPGFESHARLADSEMDRFLERAASYIGTAMLGYGLWAYKDYCHNFLYNPRFQLALVGWNPDGAVRVRANGVVLRPGAAIRQNVRADTVIRFSPAPRLELCVWASSEAGGTLSVSPDAATSTSFVINPGEKATPREHCVEFPKPGTDLPVTFRASEGTILIDGAILNGHHEVAGMYGLENHPTQLHSTFVRFNSQLTAAHAARCPEWVEEGSPLDGKFTDGWLTGHVKACLTVPTSSTRRLELRLFVPAPLPVPVRGVFSAGRVRQRFSLNRDLNTLTVSAPTWSPGTEVAVAIVFDDEFVPKAHALGDDERRLAAIFAGMGFARPGPQQ